MKIQTTRVLMASGEFMLEQSPQGILSWSSRSGSRLPPPETGPVLLWDGCVDAAGEFHLFLHTASRHLIHCQTADGQHWQRHTLSHLDREDVLLTDLCCSALPSLTLVYLLSGAGQSPAAVCYSQNPQGNWQGRRMVLPEPGSNVSLIALLGTRDSSVLYTLHQQSRIWCIPFSPQPAHQICSFPSPIQQPQLLRSDDGKLHLAFVSGQQIFADGCRLNCKGDKISLYVREQKLICACRTVAGWQEYLYTDQGWQPGSILSPGDPQRLISSSLCCLQPPESPAPLSSHTTAAEPASHLTTILHNQAVLLSSLQESFRELQQQYFAIHAQVQALQAQQKVFLSLKETCARLESALSAPSDN